MPCACGGGGATQNASVNEEEWEVLFPNNRKETVKGEHAARVLATQVGGTARRK